MVAVAKTLVLMVLAVVPGGFVALLAYVAGRALLQSWHRAVANAGANARVLRATLSGIRVRDLAREARLALNPWPDARPLGGDPGARAPGAGGLDRGKGDGQKAVATCAT